MGGKKYRRRKKRLRQSDERQCRRKKGSVCAEAEVIAEIARLLFLLCARTQPRSPTSIYKYKRICIYIYMYKRKAFLREIIRGDGRVDFRKYFVVMTTRNKRRIAAKTERERKKESSWKKILGNISRCGEKRGVEDDSPLMKPSRTTRTEKYSPFVPTSFAFLHHAPRISD